MSENYTYNTWEDFDLNILILRGIYAYGYETPSPIQKKSIKHLMDKKDVIAQAQSGTGKTGAFSVGVLSNIDLSKPTTQAIILSPTHELSKQTYDVIKNIGLYLKNVNVKLLIGGTSLTDDINNLNNNTYNIIVGCPGRVLDMISRNHINTNDVSMLIIDEADQMLSFGFKEQIYDLCKYLTTSCQIALYSATLPNEVEQISHKFMNDPVKILVNSDMLTLEGIEQYYVVLDNDATKFDTLKDLYNSISMSQCIIYCNSIKRVDQLYNAMKEDNFTASYIHGNMDKSERIRSFDDFKTGKSKVLISSNVTARGIDIQQVSTVINFDVPKCVHTYLHRIGRSGRWGRKGTSINFVTNYDIESLKQIEKHYGIEIKELPESFVR